MRIGIDCQVLGSAQHTGIPNYVRQLKDNLKKLDTQHEFIFLQPKNNFPLWGKHVAYARGIEKQGIDLLHGPANTLPLFYSGRSVITIHDLAIYKYPEWFPQYQWFAKEIVVPRSIKKAGKIIVPSNATKNDLIDLFKVPHEKIVVIPHGVEKEFFVAAEQEKKNYILFVGTLEPRKNLARVIEAYENLPANLRKQYDLFIVGGRGWGQQYTAKEPGVKFLDYVPFEKLPKLYQEAALFVYPSLYEGFGLPILEAMASGTPVITSISSSMPEVAGDAALMVDPKSSKDISGAMERVLTDNHLAARLSSAGKQQAGRFTWENTARSTLQVFENLI